MVYDLFSCFIASINKVLRSIQYDDKLFRIRIKMPYILICSKVIIFNRIGNKKACLFKTGFKFEILCYYFNWAISLSENPVDFIIVLISTPCFKRFLTFSIDYSIFFRSCLCQLLHAVLNELHKSLIRMSSAVCVSGCCPLKLCISSILKISKKN